jgi:hypothetical protein
MYVSRKYRRHIVVRKPKAAAAPDADGQTDYSNPANSVVHCSRYAELTPTSSEKLQDPGLMQMISRTTWQIKLRYDSLTSIIDPSMWIEYRGKTLHIEASYDVQDLHREMLLVAIEKTT